MIESLTAAEQSLVIATLARRKLELYRPYDKQILFHNVSIDHREILNMSANQCVSPWTFIETGDGERRCGDIFFEVGAHVRSWDGESECNGQISQGILRGIEPAFRVILESGHWFDCSSTHRILTEHGYCRIAQLMSVSSGLHLKHRVEDYQANCVAYGYLCGLPPRLEEGSAQDVVPLINDVQRHTLSFSHEDAEERIRQYTNFFQEYDLHSTFACGRKQREALFSLFSAPYVGTSALSYTDAHRKNLRLLLESSHRIQSSGESVTVFHEESLSERESVSIFYPLSSPKLVGGEKIIAYVPIGFQPIIDCHVPNYNNYILQGVIHHNCGKTFCAAAQTAMHATGKYPKWYTGRKFKKAPVIWCAGVTGEVVRDTIQRLLIGDVANPGTGLIPPLDIVETMPSRGVADLVDTILVKHISGPTTRIRLKYYEQGREKFQADTVDFVHLDEEPDEGIYLEALTRTNATGGYLIMTFTPLKGMSTVVRRFLNEPSPDRIVINMTIDDALHIPEAERKKIIDSYPLHERAARTRGEPMLGSGAIFPIADEDIMCEPFDTRDVPFYWMELAALDFGWDHPTAAVKLLYNPQDDIIYVTNTYRRREATPLQHAAALKSWGNVPFAWPHDGLQHDKGSGVPLKEIYRQQGLNMLSDNARFEDGSNGVEAGIAEMLMRMETGRLKVFRHLSEWFEEKRMYHRREGKIWKEFDDILSAHRYGQMCLRFAQRVRKPPSVIGEHYGAPKDSYNDPDWNPLGHKYIDEMLGGKK